MNITVRQHGVACLFLLTTLTTACGAPDGLDIDAPSADQDSLTSAPTLLPQTSVFPNATGVASTYSLNGPIDTSSKNPFFRSLGTNGRSCGSCHVPGSNWTVTPSELAHRFASTNGTDPVFRLVDGANSPNADVSTVAARTKAYSMLLTKGLIRVGIGVPVDGELELVAVDDPYHYASAAQLSLFRRPLPSTNLRSLSATMWDGRESSPVANPLTGPNNGSADLAHQANDATLGHAQAAVPLDAVTQAAIATFEAGLFTAQVSDFAAGVLSAAGGQGGPLNLSTQVNYFGINDVVAGDSRTGTPFNPQVFTIYNAWASSPVGPKTSSAAAARASVARGQALFNTKPLVIAGVRGV
ncbi:MAG TPA: hypothetical protein VFH51_11735, partial [Myxococcota bacterium]|nr:hypothetical protein [Myxococcota bacterium]